MYRFALKLRAPKIRIFDEAGSNEARENSRSIHVVGTRSIITRAYVLASCCGKIYQYFFLEVLSGGDFDWFDRSNDFDFK